ncbi:DUF7793 family protein [Parvicella tangerina]|uniref:DUF7793 domain-containing protein n=1 Tax=Parvicella tangerina TaxID=2829795 RepID=A0A916JMH9_9FLAO|nr:hypothetical protein [Parvicella tangerina]CAG5080907.1 hypothetical protein CRYO30217_01477 [Parvicella tangerina]
MDEIEIGDHFTMMIKNGITHISVKPDTTVELEMVQKVVQHQREIQKGSPYLVLLDVSKAYGVTREAREYTSSEAVEGLQIAMAMLTQSLPIRLLANFFIKFDNPPAPTKMFNDYDLAISWLESYR